jgi:hypothetical protein
MSKPTDMNRRFFLRGAGSAALALPFLPSLLSSQEAHAAGVNNRLFMGFTTSHGCRRIDMFPAASTLTDMTTAGGHTVRRGALAPTTSNGNTVVSNVLTASSTELTPALVGKMNVLQGLDMTWNMDHHYGRAAFGNLAAGNISFGADPICTTASNHRRSIDQVMAWSPTFYSSLVGVQQRAITLGYNETISFGYSNPQTGTGTIQEVYQNWNSKSLFESLFPAPPQTPTGTPLVDLVLANYNSVRQTNRRLSKADRTRIDEHMQRMSELQRRLNTASSCADRPTTFGNNDALYGYQSGNWYTSPDKQVAHAQMMNEVIALGMACGATRCAVYNQQWPTSFSTKEWNDFHDNGPGHGLNSTEAMGQEMAAMKRLFFSGVVLDMARRLESLVEGSGTALDRALLCWQDEHGTISHSSISVPAITFGSAGGFLKTGNYCDYRNQAGASIESDKAGLPYQQHWGTILQAMGVAHSEYQEPDHNGYGKRLNGGNGYSGTLWSDAVWAQAGEVLPFLKA